MSELSKKHFYGLDLLRIFAASMVLLHHFALFGWRDANVAFSYGSDAAFPVLAPFAGTGAVGVEIFFVISGFVIAMSAVGARGFDFAKNRFIRLAPTLWICATIAFLAKYLYGDSIEELLPAYLNSIILSPKGPYVDGVVWTLVVEAVFYAVVFLFLVMRDRFSLEEISILLAVPSICFLTVFGIASMDLFDGSDQLREHLNRFYYKVLLLRHGVFFAAGMLIYSSYSVGRSNWKTIVIAVCCLFGLVEISVSAGTISGAIVRSSIWLLSLGAILASVWFSTKIEAYFSSHHRLILDLGRWSYPLYLNHYTLGSVLTASAFAAGLSVLPAFALSMGTVLVSSWIIMRWPERKLQRLLRQWLFKYNRPEAVSQRHGK